MNRRTLLSFLGIAPAATATGLDITSSARVRIGAERVVEPELKLSGECCCQTCADLKWIKAHTRRYSPELGDVGRGAALPVEKVVDMVPLVVELGFTPIDVWGRYSPGVPTTRLQSMSGRYLPVSEARSAAQPRTPYSADLWFGFTRVHKGGHEILAFELNRNEAEDFHQAIGWSL